ncbi:MAG: hypothetical protein ACYCWW_00400 [Deltaproteobacteria bacterium]
MGRWDFLYDIERQPIGDWLLDRLAEELEKDVRAFPPPSIEGWENDEATRRFEPLLLGGRRPSEAAIRTALWLAQADLDREFEAVDAFMRSGGLDSRLGSPEDRELCQLLWRFLVDKVLAFSEATHSRFKRRELASTIARLERRLFKVIVA